MLTHDHIDSSSLFLEVLLLLANFTYPVFIGAFLTAVRDKQAVRLADESIVKMKPFSTEQRKMTYIIIIIINIFNVA